MISLVGILGYAFVLASAIAKIVNMATNAGALLFFIPGGHVVWGLGPRWVPRTCWAATWVRRTVVARGSRFVRVVFIVVVTALLARPCGTRPSPDPAHVPSGSRDGGAAV